MTVAELVERGRTPHQRWWRQWSSSDQRAVDPALAATGLGELSEQPLDTLSGVNVSERDGLAGLWRPSRHQGQRLVRVCRRSAPSGLTAPQATL